MTKKSIREKVKQRIDQYKEEEWYQELNHWDQQYFQPLLGKIRLNCISWESTIDNLQFDENEKTAILDFYENCKRFN